MSLINKENANSVVIWAFIGLVTIIGGLALLNANSYVSGIAAMVYQNQGIPQSDIADIKEDLIELDTKLQNVEGNVGEIREDFRTLINKL